MLEAQQRVGGRVCTLREPFSDGLYAETGAMRIPRAHDLTMAYIEKFDVKVSPFTMGNPNAFYYLHGKRFRIARGERESRRCWASRSRRTSAARRRRSCGSEALKPIDGPAATRRASAAWPEIVAEYDQLLARASSSKPATGPRAAIEMFGLLADQEALMNASFLELLREEAGNYYTNMVEVDGGMDHLPRAFLPDLHRRIRFGAKMIAIDQSPDVGDRPLPDRRGRARR